MGFRFKFSLQPIQWIQNLTPPDLQLPVAQVVTQVALKLLESGTTGL